MGEEERVEYTGTPFEPQQDKIPQVQFLQLVIHT